MKPIDPSSERERVGELALQKCVEELTEQESQELSSLLQHSAENREVYWETILLHSQLQWNLGSGDGSLSTPAEILRTAESSSSPTVYPAFRKVSIWLLSISACLAIVASGSAWLLQNHQRFGLFGDTDNKLASNSEPVLGTVVSLASGSRWSFGRPGDENSSTFRQGDTIWLENGAAEVRLENDSVAILEGPLVMEAVTPHKVHLVRGSIKVDVASANAALSVETPAATIDDLGTEYLVSVTKDDTDVVVLDGEVDLVLGDSIVGKQVLSKRLGAGEAVKVNAEGKLSRILSVQQSDAQSRRGNPVIDPVIMSVIDNDSRGDLWKFYEIVPGGMREDALSFVDRRHQWNGVTSEGMPKYLLAGDYVKMFNDDKIRHDLQIQFQLARPATLYVLLDDRVIAPQWLRDSFENTGDDIGIDEVPYDPHDEKVALRRMTQKGPGKSIDRKHSIWKRVVLEPGIVSLGANGQLAKPVTASDVQVEASMYGVVAVPLTGGRL